MWLRRFCRLTVEVAETFATRAKKAKPLLLHIDTAVQANSYKTMAVSGFA
jgi:hypothetical protein